MVDKVKEVALIGILSSLIFTSQVVLAPLPNIELVSFLFLIYTFFLPIRTVLAISFVFSTLEMLTWGLGSWVVGYYWIWPVWIFIIHLLKPIIKESAYGWAIVSAIWGAAFGGLFAINYGIFYSFNFSIAYWIRGLMFDLVHSVSNYLVTLILFKPVYFAFGKLMGGIQCQI